MAFCSKCGAQVDDDARFCKGCGASTGGEVEAAPAPEPAPVAAPLPVVETVPDPAPAPSYPAPDPAAAYPPPPAYAPPPAYPPAAAGPTPAPRKKSKVGLIVGIIVGLLLLCGLGSCGFIFVIASGQPWLPDGFTTQARAEAALDVMVALGAEDFDKLEKVATGDLADALKENKEALSEGDPLKVKVPEKSWDGSKLTATLVNEDDEEIKVVITPSDSGTGVKIKATGDSETQLELKMKYDEGWKASDILFDGESIIDQLSGGGAGESMAQAALEIVLVLGSQDFAALESYATGDLAAMLEEYGEALAGEADPQGAPDITDQEWDGSALNVSWDKDGKSGEMIITPDPETGEVSVVSVEDSDEMIIELVDDGGWKANDIIIEGESLVAQFEGM